MRIPPASLPSSSGPASSIDSNLFSATGLNAYDRKVSSVRSNVQGELPHPELNVKPELDHVPYSAYVSFATMILQLVMLLLQLALTLKIREGSEWARAGLTAVTVLTIAYSIILTVAGLESGGGGTVAVAIISIPLTAFF